MLKVTVDGTKIHLESSGTMAEKTCELGIVISSMYNSFKQSSPVMADVFRHIVTAMVTDPDTPLWETSSEAEGCTIVIPKPKEADHESE